MSTLLERRRQQIGRAKAAKPCAECLLETVVCEICGKCPDCCFCEPEQPAEQAVQEQSEIQVQEA